MLALDKGLFVYYCVRTYIRDMASPCAQTFRERAASAAGIMLIVCLICFLAVAVATPAAE